MRIEDTVQYSSHLVNLVIQGFGDQRLATDYDLAAVGRKFYEHFEDSYEVLAIVPRAIHIDQFSAYHQTVQNQVNGIGKDRVSRFAQYGSAGRLLGVEAYHNIGLLDNEVSNHELTHVRRAVVPVLAGRGVAVRPLQPVAAQRDLCHEPLTVCAAAGRE